MRFTSTGGLLLASVGVLPWLVQATPPSEAVAANSTWKSCGATGEVGTAGRKAGRNYWRCSDGSSDSIPPDGSALFKPFDVYYNGTMTIETPGKIDCPIPIKEQRATFTIGQMRHPENNTIDRSTWEDNPFSFSFFTAKTSCSGYYAETHLCPPSFEAYSSSTGWYWSQFWKTTIKKIENGYAITGNYTTYKYNGANSWFLYTGNCTADPRRQWYGDDQSVVVDGLTMTGTVTADKADVTFIMATPAETITPIFKFSGQLYKNSAKLVTTGDTIGTTGRLTYDDPVAGPESSAEKTMKMIKTIVPPVVGGIFLLLCVLCCYCCFRKRKQKVPQPVGGQGPDDIYLASAQQPPPPQYQTGPYEPYASGGTKDGAVVTNMRY